MRKSNIVTILILAAALVAVAVYFFKPPKRILTEQSREVIAKIELGVRFPAALDLYRIDNKMYPTTEQGLEALLQKPLLAPVPQNWKGPYLKDKKNTLDPWGRPYRYVLNGEGSKDAYQLSCDEIKK